MRPVRTHHPRHVAARLLPLILLALGMVLADLTVVMSPTPSPAPERSAWAALVSHPAPAALPDAGALTCPGRACQPVMLAAHAGKRSVARARFSVPGDPGVPRARDLLARFAPLSLLVSTATLRDRGAPLHELPWRPARVTGADRSIPRPPPDGG